MGLFRCMVICDYRDRALLFEIKINSKWGT